MVLDENGNLAETTFNELFESTSTTSIDPEVSLQVVFPNTTIMGRLFFFFDFILKGKATLKRKKERGPDGKA